MSRYENSIIYKICCRDPTVTDFYVGSCCNFARRKSSHKSACNNPNSPRYNYFVYQKIRENGGWDNFQMLELLSFSCESKRELELKEREYIELLRPTLNLKIPARTKKEYYEQNKDKIRDYLEENKEKISERWKEYYQHNKDKINEHRYQKLQCACGVEYTRQHKAIHEKSKRHTQHLENL